MSLEGVVCRGNDGGKKGVLYSLLEATNELMDALVRLIYNFTANGILSVRKWCVLRKRRISDYRNS